MDNVNSIDIGDVHSHPGCKKKRKTTEQNANLKIQLRSRYSADITRSTPRYHFRNFVTCCGPVWTPWGMDIT